MQNETPTAIAGGAVRLRVLVMPKLITQTHLDGSTCVDRAIERLRMFEPPEGYWLAFSGGKDSCCLKALADMAGVKYDAHYSITPDPPPLLRFIKRHHPDVVWERHPKYRNFYEGLVANGLPLRTTRWCCAQFKEGGGHGRLKLLGVRQAEGRASGGAGRVTRVCYRTGDRAIQPIFDWSDTEVWSFIRSQGLPYCELYDQGWTRIGCAVCPFVRGDEIERARAHWPWMFDLLRTACHKLWERKAGNPVYDTRWASADDMLAWWLLRDEPYPKQGDYWRMTP